MTTVHLSHISDGWEEVSDEEDFAMVSSALSASLSESDTVIVPPVEEDEPDTTWHTASSFPGTRSPSPPAVDLQPPYDDSEADAATVHENASDNGSHDDGVPVSDSPNPTDLLSCLAQTEKDRAELARLNDHELSPVRSRLGQQVAQICTKVGDQIGDLRSALSIFEGIWATHGATISLDPALQKWMTNVQKLLVIMLPEVETVSVLSLALDSSTRHEEVDNNVDDVLLGYYISLVDYSSEMDVLLSELPQ